MESREKNIEVKKQIMFSLENDYYFITYNLIYILYVMRCTSEKRPFRDYEKLSYMIPFISDDALLQVLGKEKVPFKEERRKLKEIYINSRMKQKLILLIINALEKKGYVSIRKREKTDTLDLWLNTDRIPNVFVDQNLYQYEITNINSFWFFS